MKMSAKILFVIFVHRVLASDVKVFNWQNEVEQVVFCRGQNRTLLFGNGVVSSVASTDLNSTSLKHAWQNVKASRVLPSFDEHELFAMTANRTIFFSQNCGDTFVDFEFLYPVIETRILEQDQQNYLLVKTQHEPNNNYLYVIDAATF